MCIRDSQSAVAAAAYQSGERLSSEYDQTQKYYSHKSEIVHTEIMLPPHAPPEYADRNTSVSYTHLVRPFLSEKFDITKHPNFKYPSDYDKKNAFDIERFLSARLKLRPDEQFAAYSIDLSGDEAAEETGG